MRKSGLFVNTVTLLVWRIAVLYALLMVCRTVFWFYNEALLSTQGTTLGQLLWGSLRFDTISILYTNALFIVLSLLPARFRSRQWWQNMLMWLYVVTNSLFVVMPNLADIIYFHYTQKRFTSDELLFADNSNSAQLVLKFAAENWYIVLIGIALIALLTVAFVRKPHKQATRRLPAAVFYPANVVLLGVAAALIIGGIRGGFTRMTRPTALSNAMQYAADNAQAQLILSNPFCIIRTLGTKSVRVPHYFDDADALAAQFSPYHYPPATISDTAPQKRNVVIFIMESMSAEHSAYLRPDLYAHTSQPVGFTPFLDSLMHESLCFKRMYANGTRSIQAMPAVLGSIPSLKEPFVLMPQSLGKSCCLPALLNIDGGYTTSFFCGSERGSMGFGAYARQAGVERLYSKEDYEAARGHADFDGFWGIWDDKFLQYMGAELGNMQQPFFAACFTLSSHHPFAVPADREKSLPEGFTKIHRCVAYEDDAYREFFASVRDTEWYKNTIFVFVADHVSSEKYAASTRTFPGNRHIIGFIYAPDGSLRRTDESIAQQIDIMPTVLGILGYRKPYFAFGRDCTDTVGSRSLSWLVGYEGAFTAMNADESVTLAEEEYPTDPSPLTLRLEAFVQQYYTCCERRDYTVPE